MQIRYFSKNLTMIAIADGGSTKCDWVILDNAGGVMLQAVTDGFNPNLIPRGEICTRLLAQPVLNSVKAEVTKVFFYGSGCGLLQNREIVREEFQSFFTRAEITVKDDLTAAAYAAYEGTPAIICILGTGSNSCFFDGKEIRRDLPSLGYLLGDEGSGSAIGKQLLKKYFMKKLPPDLHEEFTKEYGLTIEEAIAKIYHNPRANAWLGGFNKFAAERGQHPFIQEMIFAEFRNFLHYQVLPYPEAHSAEINFIGYIAFIYEEILRAAAAEFNLNVGNILQKPISRLVDYHKKHMESS